MLHQRGRHEDQTGPKALQVASEKRTTPTPNEAKYRRNRVIVPLEKRTDLK
ncbi:hypothetical protein AIOL_004553 [Candidatus Rhodobacter oscarellae]|uniref:Uncharacterized protein n=1 Tax=Candidatus Rhodobacter oscarellae TaxID=1675527 RepID=A0A0J9EAB4_9RHOB|nr:hypothetical protein AIOL_004553 [Candidatus Rhodobacter lobularis]